MTVRLPRSWTAACLLGLLAGSAPAQSSGFVPGELIYYSQAIPGMPTTGGGILRSDPVTGATSILLDVWSASSRQDAIAYDAFRERLLFYGSLPSDSSTERLYALDGFGNATPMGNEGAKLHAIAPASAGRVYFVRDTPATLHGSDLAYLDAADQVRVLMDSTGTQPFQLVTTWADALVYDAGTNALFAAVRRNSPWNCGSTNPNCQVMRIPLSEDGSRVVGPSECVEVVVDASLGSAPVGLSHGPAGQLAIVITSASTGEAPRMQRVDPVTMTVSPYATSDYFGATATNAGTWSTALGRVVIADAFHNVLRSYAMGGSGEGSVINTSIPISGSGSAEGICLIEVAPGNGATVGTYCQGKLTSEGCTPQISTAGAPSVSTGAGFDVSADQVVAQKPGLFFFGLGGPAATPFQGGTLCVQPALIRTPVVDSGGAGPCGGVLSVDFNAYLASPLAPPLSAGDLVHGQFWFRDPVHPIAGTGLSNGVTFTLQP